MQHIIKHESTPVECLQYKVGPTYLTLGDPGGGHVLELLDTGFVPQHARAGASNAVKDLVAGTDGCDLCHL